MRAVIVFVLAAIFVASCSDRREAASTSAPPRVLGVVWKEGGASFVTRLAGRTLEPLPGPQVALGTHSGPWAFSPDGSRVVFPGPRGIRIVDLERMRRVADVANDAEWAGAVAWPTAHRIVLVEGMNWEAGVEVVLVDPDARRAVFRRSLRGSLQDHAATPEGLALLLGGPGIRAARLALVSAAGAMRVVTLDRVQAGFRREDLARGFSVDHFRTPGVAVDTDGRRAFIVSAADEVAEVDLVSGAVRYHPLRAPSSVLGRLRRWLDPVAEAKGASDGSLRRAVWLGNGLLAVSGWDDDAFFDEDGHQQQRTVPAGVRLVDTRSWEATTLAPDAGAASLVGNRLLVYGSFWSSNGYFEGAGLRGFDLRGRELFHLFGEEPVGGVDAAGRYAYVAFDSPSGCRFAVVDLQAARLLRTVRGYAACERPSLLVPGG